MTETKTYPYKPKPFIMLLAALFFGACFAFFVNNAMNNDRGLIINRIIELAPGDATIVYWILAACCLAFVILGLLATVMSLKPRFIQLNATEVIIPFPLRKSDAVVSYAAITNLQRTKVQKQEFLIIHTGDKKTNVVSSAFKNKAAFQEFGENLMQRIQQSRSAI